MGKKTKKTKKTILLYGEGLVGERVFLTHVKNLCKKYHNDFDSDVLSFTSSSDNGGGPLNVFNEAKKVLDSGSFNRCIILIDTDVPWPEHLKTKLKGVDTIYLGCNPCMEGYFLKLLGRTIPPSSKECKKAFYGSSDPRGLKVKQVIEEKITWELLQTAYEEKSKLMRCLLDHFDHRKISSYHAGLAIKE